MLPMFLLLFLFVIADDSEVVVLRYRSYFHYFLAKWLTLTVISWIFMLVQLAAITLSGLGLPYGSQWSVWEGAPTYELFRYLSQLFSSSLSCLLAVVTYMLLGFSLLIMILLWFAHFLEKTTAVKVIIALYLLSVLSLRIPFFGQLPLTLFNHLIILHHNLVNDGRFLLTGITAIAIVAAIFYSIKRNRSFSRYFPKVAFSGLFSYYAKELLSKRNAAICAAVVVSLIFWKYWQNPNINNSEELIIQLFAGHGMAEFHILSFIEMLLLNNTPIYLLAVFIEKVNREYSLFVTARLKKRRSLLFGLLSVALLFLLLYGLYLVFFPSLALLLLGLPIDSAALALLAKAVALKIWDVINQLLFITVIYCRWGQITLSFFLLIALNLSCVIPLEPWRLLPFGLSSLQRSNILPGVDSALSVPTVLIVLSSSSFILLGLLTTKFYKYLPHN